MTHLGSTNEIYELLKQIGDGSFGTVFKARQKNNRKPVAIKVMKKKYDCIEDCEGQFEPKLLHILPPHINVVQLYDSFFSPTTHDLSFVMEYMDGGNLYQLMRERKQHNLPFNNCELRNILHQVISAVSHIHHHNIFHRDMKPENLLLDYTSGRPIIKLADFGLAREINSAPPFTEYVSTRWYRAPEVLLRSTEYSAAVDLWALGTIFAELVTFEPLFPGESEIDQIYRICEILGSPGNKFGVIGQKKNRFLQPEKRPSPGFARKKAKEVDPIDKNTISTLSVLDGGGEWKEGVKLAFKIGFKFPYFTPKPLETVIPNANKSMLDIIRHFLFFNPHQRRTADATLNHPFFSEVEESVHSKSINKEKELLELDAELSNVLKTAQYSCEICPDWNIESPVPHYGRLCSAIKDEHNHRLSTSNSENSSTDSESTESDAYLTQTRPIYSSHQKVHPLMEHLESIDHEAYLNQKRPIYSSHQKTHPVSDRPNSSQVWNPYHYGPHEPLRPGTPIVEHVSLSSRGLTSSSGNSSGIRHRPTTAAKEDPVIEDVHKRLSAHLLYHHHHPHHNDYHNRHPPLYNQVIKWTAPHFPSEDNINHPEEIPEEDNPTRPVSRQSKRGSIELLPHHKSSHANYKHGPPSPHYYSSTDGFEYIQNLNTAKNTSPDFSSHRTSRSHLYNIWVPDRDENTDTEDQSTDNDKNNSVDDEEQEKDNFSKEHEKNERWVHVS